MLRKALVLALVVLASANRQQWLQDAHVGPVRVRKHACARVLVCVCARVASGHVSDCPSPSLCSLPRGRCGAC